MDKQDITPTSQSSIKQQTTKITVLLLIMIFFISLFFYNMPKGPELIYQPVIACDILSPDKALDILGADKINDNRTNKPILSEDTGTATSQCSYTDQNESNMKVVAISIKSAYNDEGIKNISDDFHKNQEVRTTDNVIGFGDEAFFDQDKKQLNILFPTYWVLFSYGDGTDLQSHTLDETVHVAHQVFDDDLSQF